MNQNLHIQLQQYKRQRMEVLSALEHLKETDESYHLLGQVMVKKEPQELIERLNKQKESLDAQIQSLEQQINAAA